MSGLDDISNLQEAVEKFCPLYVGSFLGSLMWIWDFFPIMLTAVSFFISLFLNEIYFFIASIFLTSDTVLNMLLRQVIFKQQNQFPGCGAKYQMPSFSSQHSTFFVVLVSTFMLMWRSRLSGFRMFLLVLFYTLVITCRIYIGINTNFELMMGAVTGMIWGLILQAFTYYILYPMFDRILSLEFVQFIGMENHYYKDVYEDDTRTALGTVIEP
jgi:hypothetical protein